MNSFELFRKWISCSVMPRPGPGGHDLARFVVQLHEISFVEISNSRDLVVAEVFTPLPTLSLPSVRYVWRNLVQNSRYVRQIFAEPLKSTDKVGGGEAVERMRLRNGVVPDAFFSIASSFIINDAVILYDVHELFNRALVASQLPEIQPGRHQAIAGVSDEGKLEKMVPLCRNFPKYRAIVLGIPNPVPDTGTAGLGNVYEHAIWRF